MAVTLQLNYITVNMLYRYTDLTFLHIYAKAQPNMTSTLHDIAPCMSETNMPTTFGMYAIYLTDISRGVCTNLCHI